MDEMQEVLPKKGLVHYEDYEKFILCKPKILPLKPVTLEKLEQMQREAHQVARDRISTAQPGHSQRN